MIDSSKKVRDFFEIANRNIDLPNFWRFPTDSCEGASLFLGNILKELFPESKVAYIKGYNPSGRIHFWLNVDGLIFDITADQFPGVDFPIYASKVQPLEIEFNDLVIQPIEEAFLKSDVTNSTYKNTLMIELRLFLTGHV
jgi:hypothetical protein